MLQVSSNNVNINTQKKCVPLKVAFKGNPVATLSTVATDMFDAQKLEGVLNGSPLGVTKNFLEGLSQGARKFCIDFARAADKTFEKLLPDARTAVLQEDVRDIVKYSNCIYDGIEKIAQRNNFDMKDVMVVAIGQSPAAVVKAIELKGMKTGYCPISSLRLFEHPQPYVTPQTVEKGFSQWKNYGFDLDSIFKEKCIMFIDHKESGATLDAFKHIISKIKHIIAAQPQNKGASPAKMFFLSMNELQKRSGRGVAETIDSREIEHSLFHKSYFKTLYSPLFKLPLDKVPEIDRFSQMNTDANRRFNKFAVLLNEELSNPQELPFKSRGMLEGQRESRLSAVVGEVFNLDRHH